MLFLQYIQDALFAALAAVGFAALSNPPRRAYVYCALIAAIGHSSRFLLLQPGLCGLHIVIATAAASLLVGLLAVLVSPLARTPAEANVDSHGTVNANASLTYNRGRFESFAGLGLKSMHAPAGSESLRSYTDGRSLGSQSDSRKHENSIFLRLGSNWRPDDRNTVYLNMIGTLGHQWGHTTSTHIGDIPGMWRSNTITMKESGDTRGANILLGYRHTFNASHSIDMNVSYNIWQGENENRSHEEEIWSDTETESLWHSQTQDMRISNWEAALDYSGRLLPWLRLEAGFKGNYNHENSPASYFYGESAETFVPLPHLYNRFIYDTDINALYVSFSGSAGPVTFAAGLRGELWSIRTRSLGYGDVVTEGSSLSRNDFALFPSASAGWKFMEDNELSINYSRRIRRPYGPQLNTFENIADPSEVHLGNPQIMPEYSDAAELYTHLAIAYAVAFRLSAFRHRHDQPRKLPCPHGLRSRHQHHVLRPCQHRQPS